MAEEFFLDCFGTFTCDMFIRGHINLDAIYKGETEVRILACLARGSQYLCVRPRDDTHNEKEISRRRRVRSDDIEHDNIFEAGQKAMIALVKCDCIPHSKMLGSDPIQSSLVYTTELYFARSSTRFLRRCASYSMGPAG